MLNLRLINNDESRAVQGAKLYRASSHNDCETAFIYIQFPVQNSCIHE